MQEQDHRTPLFQDEPADGRHLSLDANCYEINEDFVRRDYSDEEMQNFRLDLSKEALQIADLEDEKKEMVAEITGRIKERKAVYKEVLSDIRKGYSETKETVYLFDYQEEGEMLIYDAQGNVVSYRALNPSERQTKMKQVKNA